MKVRSKRLLAVVAALVAVSMIATGCGGGAKQEGNKGGSDSTTVKEVKIGVGAPLTKGAVALGEGMVRGTELAIEQANEREDVKAAGLKFVAVPGDDQGDPTIGGNVANTFASDPDLVGVMGHLNSGVSIPASKIYNGKKIVQVSPASTNPALTLQGLNNVFRVCTTDEIQGKFAAEAAFNDFNLKTAYVVDDSTPYGEGLAKYFAQYFAETGGKVVGTAKTKDTDAEFNALVSKIKAAKPDVIYYGGIYNAGALLAKQAKDAGVPAPMMSGDGSYDPTFIKLAGAKNAEGDLCTSIGYPVDKLPKGQEFKDAFAAKFPGKEIAAYDAYSFDAANVIINATVKAAEELGADKVTSPEGRDAIIKNVAATKMDGMSGEVAFDEKGDTTNRVISAYIVKNGAWVPYEK